MPWLRVSCFFVQSSQPNGLEAARRVFLLKPLKTNVWLGGLGFWSNFGMLKAYCTPLRWNTYSKDDPWSPEWPFNPNIHHSIVSNWTCRTKLFPANFVCLEPISCQKPAIKYGTSQQRPFFRVRICESATARVWQSFFFSDTVPVRFVKDHIIFF